MIRISLALLLATGTVAPQDRLELPKTAAMMAKLAEDHPDRAHLAIVVADDLQPFVLAVGRTRPDSPVPFDTTSRVPLGALQQASCVATYAAARAIASLAAASFSIRKPRSRNAATSSWLSASHWVRGASSCPASSPRGTVKAS